MAPTLAQKMAEERRGFLLTTLAEAPSYRSNERLLQDVLEDVGLHCSRDQVRGDLSWLRDQGLLLVNEIAGVMVAEITQGGLDVGKGRIRVPGVARPGPG